MRTAQVGAADRWSPGGCRVTGTRVPGRAGKTGSSGHSGGCICTGFSHCKYELQATAKGMND
jgi:hypothetical protein